MGFGRDARHIRRWRRRSSISPQAIAGWWTWILEKFFDRVNHDKLMGQVAKRVTDKRVLKLLRAS